MNSSTDPNAVIFKFVLLGDPSTGKTSIASRLCQDVFTRQYYPTVGVDIWLKRVVVGNRTAHIILWDVSGHSLTSPLLNKYLYGARAILLVCDITNKASFSSLWPWLNATASVVSSARGTISILANKSDSEHQRTVSARDISQFASDRRITFYNVSARTGENVSFTFYKILAQCVGIPVSQLEEQFHAKVITAEIEPPRNKGNPHTPKMPRNKFPSKRKGCSIQ